MKVVIAPDSFKECLRAHEAATYMAEGVRRAFPDAEVILCPMADGGEGTVESILNAPSARSVLCAASDALGRAICAKYCVLNHTAVVEMAEASGLERLSVFERNPLRTHTFGTGQLIAHALERGVRDVVVAVGGSATVDGGVGMAQALGYRFADHAGNLLPPGGEYLGRIAIIHDDAVHPAVEKTTFRVAADVWSPLLGEHGAAKLYGPQKGAAPPMVNVLEQGLAHLQHLLTTTGRLHPSSLPGDGAAGGLGMGIRAFLHGEIGRGAQMVAQMVGLEAHLRHADWVITGEGRTDVQSAEGKVCAYVAELAKQRGVRSLLLSGAVSEDATEVTAQYTAWRAASPSDATREWALKHARETLARAAEEFFRTTALSGVESRR